MEQEPMPKKTKMPPVRELAILDILFHQTDETHRMSRADLVEKLLERGIDVNPRTVADDIEAMMVHHQIGITAKGRSPMLYAYEKRPLSLAQLQLLSAAVCSSPSLGSEDKTTMLFALATLTSENDAERLLQAMNYNTEPGSSAIDFYNIVLIQNAIEHRKRIYFTYRDLDPTGQELWHNNGQPYFVSPYGLTWKNDKLYLLAHYPKHKTAISHFRMDCMTKISTVVDINNAEDRPSPEYIPLEEGFDLGEYVRCLFDMYGGEIVPVTLECEAVAMKSVRDHFGTDFAAEMLRDGRYRVTHDIAVSPTFFGWVFAFGGKVKITAPAEVKQQYREFLLAQVEEE